ncbi:unnamed protein product, partial [marine sediment metagenome]
GSLEQQQADLYAKMAEPDFYQHPSECVAKVQKQAEMTEEKLAAAYSRWEELDS